MILDYIDAHRHLHGVEPICRVLTEAGTQIASSAYYAAKTRPPSARAVSDATSTQLIGRVHVENYVGPKHNPTDSQMRTTKQQTCERVCR